MASKKYKVASQEGVDYYLRILNRPEPPPLKVGDEVDMDLSSEQEQALIAAAWLEHSKKKEG